jgi:hypothetical protein
MNHNTSNTIARFPLMIDKSYPALDKEPFADDLPQIFGYFDENLGLFNSQVTSLHLQFGVIEPLFGWLRCYCHKRLHTHSFLTNP